MDGFDAKKHAGVIAEFRRRYIKTGVFPTVLSDMISELFQVRTSSDYDDFYIIEKVQAVAQFENAERFVGAVDAYLTRVYAEE